MQKIVLYIKNDEGVFKRVDMFNDESVVLKSQIQDIKDVGKIFTDFSRLFTLPSSKENNKLFKHYYNESIENGFDARNKKEALLVPIKSPKKMANSILKLLKNKKMAQKLGNNAGKRVKEKFNIKKSVKKTEQLYKKIN